MALHPDLRDLLAAFATHEVDYMLVGGYAVAFHARPRFTKDIDLLIDTHPQNVDRIAAALRAFGAPPKVIEALRSARADEIVYMGEPPVRVELFREIPGVNFGDAYPRRVEALWDGVPIRVIGRDDLISAKRATDRPLDREDVDALTRRDDEE